MLLFKCFISTIQMKLIYYSSSNHSSKCCWRSTPMQLYSDIHEFSKLNFIIWDVSNMYMPFYFELRSGQCLCTVQCIVSSSWLIAYSCFWSIFLAWYFGKKNAVWTKLFIFTAVNKLNNCDFVPKWLTFFSSSWNNPLHICMKRKN